MYIYHRLLKGYCKRRILFFGNFPSSVFPTYFQVGAGLDVCGPLYVC